MKVSCLTFHDSFNYGSILQTYALQTRLESMGHEYEVINYTNANKRNFDKVLTRCKEAPLWDYFYKLSLAPQNAYKGHMFHAFSKRFLHVTPRFYAFDELKKYAAQRDAILVGSDQVWNASMVRQDPAYFLKFTEPRKRISYAASMGISVVEDEHKAFYREMLEGFDQISVREKTAVKLIREMTGKEAKLVADPTLLLTKDEWKQICVQPPEKPYIFVYALAHIPRLQAFLEKLKKQTGLPVRYVTRGYVSAIRDGATRLPSPQEWVTQMMNAKYVVTSSFHGTAFSVNFGKTFFTITGSDGTESRQMDFLRKVGLENRLNPHYEGDIPLEAPDFTKANEILEELRSSGSTFLEEALRNVKRGED